jgi:hypothetical protein
MASKRKPVSGTNSELWVRDPSTGQPIAPKKQPGYYPGYSTLGQKNYWDANTRQVVEDRVHNIPPIRFFSEAELPIVTAIFDRLLPQHDRLPEFRIPTVNYVDERLFHDTMDGYRFANMPPDREAYQLGIQAIDRTAREIHGVSFTELDPLKQDFILKSIHDEKALAADDIWDRLPIGRFWYLILQDAVHMYYAHPWAWDEIGYGGPAYPRAYTRLEGGLPEPWEVDEQRYDWDAPPTSASDVHEQGPHPTSTSGQGGTH